MDKCNLDRSAVFLDSCGHELLEFFGCSLSEAVFVHDDVAVLVAEQKVVGPGFDAGKLEEAVLAVALACRLVHDILVNFHFAGNQKAFIVGVLPGFDLILRHVLVVAVEGIDADSDQCDGTQQSQHLMRENAQTSEINSSQCSQNTYQQCHHMILFRLLRTFIILLNNMLDDVFIQLCVILKKQFHCHNKILRKL